ncbi:MAG: 50S ribosomal protein L4 [Erysipelotrichaceae bacterium]|nr:50S ribosomal protein L4 [Erysipelotrichaceae bacterium]
MAEKVKNIKLPVVSMTGENVSTMTAKGEIFNIEPNKAVMFEAVQVYQANKRQATAKTKVRSEVSGGGKKPWKQKGTGRARAGSSRSPIWVGGGTVFGPDGRQNYSLSMNSKAHNLAVRSALSLKAKEKAIIVIDKFELAEAKTKSMVAVLKAVKAGKKVLIVLDEENENIINAAKNIAGTMIVPTDNVCVYDLLNVDTVVTTKAAIKKIEEALN